MYSRLKNDGIRGCPTSNFTYNINSIIRLSHFSHLRVFKSLSLLCRFTESLFLITRTTGTTVKLFMAGYVGFIVGSFARAKVETQKCYFNHTRFNRSLYHFHEREVV